MTVDGPTRGASDDTSNSRWESSPRLALAVRIAVLAFPAVGAFLVLNLIVDLLYHPPGTVGLIVWFVQGVVVGVGVSVILDRWARRLLPLVALLKMSMVFPDDAPSRFAVALRAGSFRRIEQRVADVNRSGLGADAAEASVKAIELITVLSGHDRMTRGHTERVRAYADIIAAQMGLSDLERAKLAWGVMLHDVGKVAVPADILNKTEPLTDTEWALLKTHPEAGGRLLAPLADWLGPWARAAAEHHERWDGGGYPRGLAGEEISLAGRITAVADAYDVITSNRSYKKAISVEAARREMVACAGAQFDPAVVRAFLNVSLGRRWTAGVLATLSNLPLANLTSAPAVFTAGVAASAATLFAADPAPDIPEVLAFEEVVDVEDSTTTSTTTTIAFAAPQQLTAEVTTTSTPASTTSTSAPTSTSSTMSTTAPSSSTSTVATTATTSTTAPTAPPTTASSSTSSTSSSTTSTTAPTTASTTTTVATTTTTASTTTTTSSTTTTTAPAATVLYLKNPGTGDTVAMWLKDLSSAGPDNTTLPNYNTDQDTHPGSWFRPTSVGFGESNSDRIEGFRTTPGTSTVLSGPTTLTVWLATDGDLGGAAAVVDADIAGCYFVVSCTSISSDSAPVTTWVDNGFQAVTFDFGSPTHTFGYGEELVVRLITTGSETIHVAFDADPNPSRLETSLS